MSVSLILGSFNRPTLLDKSLFSIGAWNTETEFEVVVINDGVDDATEDVCAKYSNSLDIKYIFSGQRNANGIIRRMAGFALNIGVKQSKYDNIILSCAEIYHLNNAIDLTAKHIQDNILVTPRFMYFDDTGNFTKTLTNGNRIPINIESVMNITMPYFMGMCKKHFIDIGGYDEDFIGYAAEDNDFVGRLLFMGCNFFYTDARVVHLFHGGRCDSQKHPENSAWAYNYNLFESRRGQVNRNIDKKWGVIE
jgi:glycosyltransferase involved in cell wall biosynthesis